MVTRLEKCVTITLNTAHDFTMAGNYASVSLIKIKWINSEKL